MSTIKIVTLMEDNLCGDNIIAEHGLSLYIETPMHRLIVDTGQSANTWENAKTKGVDVCSVDTVFLSHGHYDHCGGLMKFASLNTSAQIYIHKDAGRDYFSYKEGREKYIGIDKEILKLQNLHLIAGNTVIDDELTIFTNVSPKRNLPKGNSRLHELKNGEYIQDTFSHEMYLVIKYGRGEYALVSGCAHNGILNILDSFKEIYKAEPSLVISGFHMIQSEYSEDDYRKIRDTAAELAEMNSQFYSGHCTGDTAYTIMKEIMGEKLRSINELK